MNQMNKKEEKINATLCLNFRIEIENTKGKRSSEKDKVKEEPPEKVKILFINFFLQLLSSFTTVKG